MKFINLESKTNWCRMIRPWHAAGPFKGGRAFLLVVIALLAVSALAWGQSLPPIVNAGPNMTVIQRTTAQLAGTATDPNGLPIVAWSWVVISAPAGALNVLLSADTATPSFIGTVLGVYYLGLRAFDGVLWSDQSFVTMTVVLLQPPVVILNATPPSGPAPLTVQFDASQSYDPQAGLDPNYYDWSQQYGWDFGDGSPSSSFATVSHTFTLPGSYVVFLLVANGEGAVGAANITIQVLPPTGAITSTDIYGFLQNPGFSGTQGSCPTSWICSGSPAPGFASYAPTTAQYPAGSPFPTSAFSPTVYGGSGVIRHLTSLTWVGGATYQLNLWTGLPNTESDGRTLVAGWPQAPNGAARLYLTMGTGFGQVAAFDIPAPQPGGFTLDPISFTLPSNSGAIGQQIGVMIFVSAPSGFAANFAITPVVVTPN